MIEIKTTNNEGDTRVIKTDGKLKGERKTKRRKGKKEVRKGT